jgi:hypothetical protein
MSNLSMDDPPRSSPKSTNETKKEKSSGWDEDWGWADDSGANTTKVTMKSRGSRTSKGE